MIPRPKRALVYRVLGCCGLAALVAGTLLAQRAPTPTPTPTAPAETAATLEHPCRQVKRPGETALDATRRGLGMSLCNAVLWLDGLSGYPGSRSAARQATGEVELSAAHSAERGTEVRAGVDVNFRLPNLENEIDAFVGRDTEDDFISGRTDGFGLQSQFLEVEDEDKWLAGLGYSLPGGASERTTFRVGGSGGRQPKLFVQGRYARNFVLSDRSHWRVRETLYWRSRGEGFGETTSLDYDHVVTPNLLARWGTKATWSEKYHGVGWRSAATVYHNLHRRRAIAYEVFLRGQTATDVNLGEYGARVFYRESLDGRWTWGEVLLGYSWLQETPDVPREGSVMLGVGVDFLFGGIGRKDGP
jgi:hypothetical protein